MDVKGSREKCIQEGSIIYVATTTTHLMTESHCRAMMRLIDDEILMLRSMNYGKTANVGKQARDKSSPYKIEITPCTLIDRDKINIVSYNILSSYLFGKGHYRNLDGRVNSFDAAIRQEKINTKIKSWVESKCIVCLQEVTADFVGIQKNQTLIEMLEKNNYNVYYHHFKFDQANSVIWGLPS